MPAGPDRLCFASQRPTRLAAYFVPGDSPDRTRTR